MSKPSWYELNNAYLQAYFDWLVARLRRYIALRQGTLETDADLPDEAVFWQKVVNISQQLQPASSLTRFSDYLELSPAEQHFLMLCAGVELDGRIAGLCGLAQGDPARQYATFALGFALFPEAGWEIITPERPLRYWRLLEINQPPDRPLTASYLRADERIISYLKSINYLDDRLSPYLFPVPRQEPLIPLPPSQEKAVQEILHHIREHHGSVFPILQLTGIDNDSKQLIAQHAVVHLGLRLYRLPIELLPTQPRDLETFARIWERETFLSPVALYLDAHELDTQNPNEAKAQLLQYFLTFSNGIFILNTRELWTGLGRTTYSIEIAKPTPVEQMAIWQATIPQINPQYLPELTAQFNLSVAAIYQIARSILAEIDPVTVESSALENALWNACLAQTRPRLDMLAQRIPPKAKWDDLILPEEELKLLHQIVGQVKHRSTVYQDWGYSDRTSRGLGMTVLFAGESGTGKTLSAEILANHLRLNLYRIDLSSVVSKYIGETEKNLRRLFDAAEDGGAILFFDEADALFGKRSQVKDSHDRYANIEVNYLLQRMESYRGLAILATNLKSGLDDAFTRRLRFAVTFPLPDKINRRWIWQQIFPDKAPTQANLNYRYLAEKFDLSGGSIYNIALNAAFMAAADESEITMRHVLDAVKAEHSKQDRLLNEKDYVWEEETAV